MDRSEAMAVVLAVTTGLLAVLMAVVIALLPDRAAAPRFGGAPSAACQEWSDGCIVCARRPEGIACSMPGIACTRDAPRCLSP
jgi:hypothetical protein